MESWLSIPGLLPAFLSVTLLGLCAGFCSRLWQARMFVRSLQRRGLPMPAHNFCFGHLLFIWRARQSVPADLDKMQFFGFLMERDFAETGSFYLDLWPIRQPFLITKSPTLATQAAVTNSKISTRRPLDLNTWFQPFAGGPNLFDLPAKEWKPWRQLFSSGFASANTLLLVPYMVEETLIFRTRLKEHAVQNSMFLLDPVCLRYVADLMGRIVLNTSLNAQSGPHCLIDSMDSQIDWQLPEGDVNVLRLLNVARPIIQSRNGYAMDRFVGAELDKRFRESQDGRKSRTRTVIDLILQAYLDGVSASADSLDPAFRTFAIHQIRLFAFVGQGSTTASLVYAIHLLSTHPGSLARLRAEHDAVFGTKPESAAAQLSQQPHLLNQLAFTKATIKETLRLYPAASGIRQGSASVELVEADGTCFPTDRCYVWILHWAMQRSEANFVQANTFLPERWLAQPGDPIYPQIKGAWRPFELGPRNCPAQDLVMMEITVALVILSREFDFANAYAEWDALHPSSTPRTHNGERAYQTERGGARPVNGYPCRVSMTASAKGLGTDQR